MEHSTNSARSDDASDIDLKDASGELFNKALAARVVTRIDRHQSFVADQVSSMAKWLMASLLGINGAGAIAVLNAAKESTDLAIPGLLFVLGTGAALLSGVTMQKFYNGVSEPLLAQDSYWTEVAIRGTRSVSTEQENSESFTKSHRLAFLPPTLGWISGFLFLTAALLSMKTIIETKSRIEARCLTLQRTMLSTKPHHTDSFELFKALSCKAN